MKDRAFLTEVAQLGLETVSNNVLNAIQAMEGMKHRPSIVPERGPGNTIYYRVRTSARGSRSNRDKREKVWVGRLNAEELYTLRRYIIDNWPPNELHARESWIRQMQKERRVLMSEAKVVAAELDCSFRGYWLTQGPEYKDRSANNPEALARLMAKMLCVQELCFGIDAEHQSILRDCDALGITVSERRKNRAESAKRRTRSASTKAGRSVDRLKKRIEELPPEEGCDAH